MFQRRRMQEGMVRIEVQVCFPCMREVAVMAGGCLNDVKFRHRSDII